MQAGSTWREVHAKYLLDFISNGFVALDKLQALDAMQAKLPVDNPTLLGLGPEKAGQLLAACNAVPRLLSVLYWVVCGLKLLQHALPSALEERLLQFVQACRHDCGGYSPHPDHPADLLASLSAVQLFILLGRKDMVADRADSLRQFVLSLRSSDGSFTCRPGSEDCDCRFVYSALNLLALLGPGPVGTSPAMGTAEMEVTTSWLLRCQNLDGGFGCLPDGACESHAGHTFCCMAALALLDAVPKISQGNQKRLLRWLAFRQCAEGGLNGRPGKAPDVCYTWWVLASTTIFAEAQQPPMSVCDLIDGHALRRFVDSCAAGTGGIAPHPGDDPDVFHTFFGVAGLALLDAAAEGTVQPELARWGNTPPCMNPRVALPSEVLHGQPSLR
mmetsp:Transcript_53474/g.98909  ORF Transcript_53474/g.98909 Transcript_53474/m.98909 type:complete len:387 (+) Transcript_53474:103-1263(+)